MPPEKSWLAYLREPNPWTTPEPLPPAIVTDRLVIRLYQAGDGPALFEAIDRERSSMLPHMVWVRTEHLTLDDSIFFVETCRRDIQEPDVSDFFMGIFDRTSGALIGGTGFRKVNAGLSTSDVGYWIRSSRRRNGYCVEATRALLSAAFRPAAQGGWGFRRIVITCDVTNLASRRVCERMGLRLESQTRQSQYLGPIGSDGAPGYQDILGFGVLASEWDVDRQALRG